MSFDYPTCPATTYQSEVNIFVAWSTAPFPHSFTSPVSDLRIHPPFVYTIMDLVSDSTSFPVDATHVLRSRASTFQVAPCLCCSWPLAPSFGGIHCVGWDSPFPTSTERKLWRVPSLAVTTIPIDLILIALVITLHCQIPQCNR